MTQPVALSPSQRSSASSSSGPTLSTTERVHVLAIDFAEANWSLLAKDLGFWTTGLFGMSIATIALSTMAAGPLLYLLLLWIPMLGYGGNLIYKMDKLRDEIDLLKALGSSHKIG